MKILIILALISTVYGEIPAPYPASGWRPQGEPFTLPSRQQQSSQEYGAPPQNQQQQYNTIQYSAAQLNQEYGAPESQINNQYGAPQINQQRNNAPQINQQYGAPQINNQYGIPSVDPLRSQNIPRENPARSFAGSNFNFNQARPDIQNVPAPTPGTTYLSQTPVNIDQNRNQQGFNTNFDGSRNPNLNNNNPNSDNQQIPLNTNQNKISNNDQNRNQQGFNTNFDGSRSPNLNNNNHNSDSQQTSLNTNQNRISNNDQNRNQLGFNSNFDGSKNPNLNSNNPNSDNQQTSLNRNQQQFGSSSNINNQQIPRNKNQQQFNSNLESARNPNLNQQHTGKLILPNSQFEFTRNTLASNQNVQRQNFNQNLGREELSDSNEFNQDQLDEQSENGEEYNPEREYGVPTTTRRPIKAPRKPERTTARPRTTTEQPETDNDGSSDQPNVAISTAVAGMSANGQYYILQPDGRLQRVVYMTSPDPSAENNAAVVANLMYENVEPLRGPIYQYVGSELVRIN